MKSSRAAFLDKETIGFMFSISQHSLRRSMTDRRSQNVKIRACWPSCEDDQLVCMASSPKCGPCMVISVLFHSSSFQRDIILSHGHCPLNQPEQTTSCMIVYMGKVFGRNLRLWYTVTPNGERFPGNWTSAETQEFKKGKKVNVSSYHWNKLLTVD